jgi:hypothetical protein
MKISIYTIVKNGIYFDLHVEAMLRQHLPLADEIIVNEGYSSDDTYERITRIDPKIKVFREHWDAGEKSGVLYAEQKNKARERCTGDWCILLDCDEFIAEWEFDRIRRELARATEPIMRLRHVQFYANYKVIHPRPEKVNWGLFKEQVHRNDPKMRVIGDGSNVVCGTHSKDLIDYDTHFETHHMGQVRNPARLRHKWRIEHKLKLATPKWDKTPGFMFDLAPHDWFDRDYLEDLRTYDGPWVQEVVNNPAEFIRDEMKLYEFLRNRESATARPEPVEGTTLR